MTKATKPKGPAILSPEVQEVVNEANANIANIKRKLKELGDKRRKRPE